MSTLLKTRVGGIVCGGLLVVFGGLLGRITVVDNTGAFTEFGETVLHASTASTGGNFALATGEIDEETEGVFVLDFATGELSCAVLSHRNRKFAALFRTNVTKDLGPSKNANYQLVTGAVDFNRAAGAGPGRSVAYVLNSTTGKMAAYGIPWQREQSATGRPQVGVLKLIDGMDVRNNQVNEQ